MRDVLEERADGEWLMKAWKKSKPNFQSEVSPPQALQVALLLLT